MDIWNINRLIDLETQIAVDKANAQAQAGDQALVIRDQQIAKAHFKENKQTDQKLSIWLTHVSESNQLGTSAKQLFTFLRNALVILGIIFGFLTGIGLFYSDGTQPISILLAFGILIALPFIFLLLTVFIQLNSSWYASSGGPLQLLLGNIFQNLLKKALHNIPDSYQYLNQQLKRRYRNNSLYFPILKTTFTMWVQLFSLAFFITVLISFISLITLTDISFAWGSTLKLTPDSLKSITDTISTPWTWAWQEARPSAELIENTRFSRLDNQYLEQSSKENTLNNVGDWWPFLAMSILFYTVIPRTLLSVLLASSRKSKIQTIILNLSQFDDIKSLLDRFNLQQTHFNSNFSTEKPNSIPQEHDQQQHIELSNSSCIILWNEPNITESILDSSIEKNSPQEKTLKFAAGHGLDSRIDEEVLKEVSAHKFQQCLFIVDQDEQPVAECKAFLMDMVTVCPAIHIHILISDDTEQNKENLAHWQKSFPAENITIHLLSELGYTP